MSAESRRVASENMSFGRKLKSRKAERKRAAAVARDACWERNRLDAAAREAMERYPVSFSALLLTAIEDHPRLKCAAYSVKTDQGWATLVLEHRKGEWIFAQSTLS